MGSRRKGLRPRAGRGQNGHKDHRKTLRKPLLHPGAYDVGMRQGLGTALPHRSRYSAADPCFAAPQVRRRRFGDERIEDRVHRAGLLRLRSEPAHGNRPLGRLLAADDQHHRHFRQRMFPHLVVDLLVAKIDLGAQAAFSRGRDDFHRVIVRLLRDRRDD